MAVEELHEKEMDNLSSGRTAAQHILWRNKLSQYFHSPEERGERHRTIISGLRSDNRTISPRRNSDCPISLNCSAVGNVNFESEIRGRCVNVDAYDQIMSQMKTLMGRNRLALVFFI